MAFKTILMLSPFLIKIIVCVSVNTLNSSNLWILILILIKNSLLVKLPTSPSNPSSTYSPTKSHSSSVILSNPTSLFVKLPAITVKKTHISTKSPFILSSVLLLSLMTKKPLFVSEINMNLNSSLISYNYLLLPSILTFTPASTYVCLIKINLILTLAVFKNVSSKNLHKPPISLLMMISNLLSVTSALPLLWI